MSSVENRVRLLQSMSQPMQPFLMPTHSRRPWRAGRRGERKWDSQAADQRARGTGGLGGVVSGAWRLMVKDASVQLPGTIHLALLLPHYALLQTAQARAVRKMLKELPGNLKSPVINGCEPKGSSQQPMRRKSCCVRHLSPRA